MVTVKIVFSMLAMGAVALPWTHQGVKFQGTDLEVMTYKGVSVIHPIAPAGGQTSLLELKFPKPAASITLKLAAGSPTTIRGFDKDGKEIKASGLPISLKATNGFVYVMIGAKDVEALSIESRNELYVESVEFKQPK